MSSDFPGTPPYASRYARRGTWLWIAVGLLVTASGLAADATLSWDSLSGEQQYMLARLRPRWETLDLAGRRELLARAANFKLQGAARSSLPAPVAEANATSKAPALRQRSHRRRALSPAEASLSAHSFRLRRVLRAMPGLGAEERRDVLARWGELRNSERIEMVERYSRNIDDDEQIAMQRALREGRISPKDLQRGLTTGKIKGDELKAALSSGRISIDAIKEGITSSDIIAEDLEKALRRGNIESSDLSETIETSRLPDGSSREEILQAATARKAAIEARPPGTRKTPIKARPPGARPPPLR